MRTSRQINATLVWINHFRFHWIIEPPHKKDPAPVGFNWMLCCIWDGLEPLNVNFSNKQAEECEVRPVERLGHILPRLLRRTAPSLGTVFPAHFPLPVHQGLISCWSGIVQREVGWFWPLWTSTESMTALVWIWTTDGLSDALLNELGAAHLHHHVEIRSHPPTRKWRSCSRRQHNKFVYAGLLAYMQKWYGGVARGINRAIKMNLSIFF